MTAERAPRISWCWFCHRAVRHDDDTAVTVTIDGATEFLCGPCFDKADVGPAIPMDMMEEEPPGHEGDPEWNGAFG